MCHRRLKRTACRCTRTTFLPVGMGCSEDPMPRDANGLTPKQALFVAEYRKDLNATQAAIRAGYAPNAAQEQSSKLLSNPIVASAVADLTQKQLDRADLTASRTLEAIRRPMVADVRKLFNADGSLKAITALEDDEAALIAGFEVIVKNAQAGDGHTDTVHKIKIVDRARYVEMAAKHFKLLTDVMEHKGLDGLADRLKAGKKRVGAA